MKLNNRFIFGILSLYWQQSLLLWLCPPLPGRPTGKSGNLSASPSLCSKASRSQNENAEVVEVGGYNLPANVAHSLDDVEGLYVTADLAAGDYILTSKVSSVPISSDVALNDIPSGKVAISLTVKSTGLRAVG